MRVGIVTWHDGNIGSVLQAYALSESVKKLNYDVEVFNYIESKSELGMRFIRNIMFHICYLKSGLTRDNIYSFFKARVKESPNLLYKELEDYAKRMDAVICGSDQIWSSATGFKPYYFLRFIDKNKRISYAPSIGLSEIDEKSIDIFKKYVSEIPFLSIREDRGAEIIRQYTGLDAKMVLDPTFLLKREEWLSLTADVSLSKFNLEEGEYILCYYLGDFEKYKLYTDRLESETGKKTIFVSFKRVNYGKKQIVCTVEEFIGLINHSWCVLTDSFHGTIMSINLMKKVGVFERFSVDDSLNQNSRIYSILKLLGIGDWILDPQDKIDFFMNRVSNFDEVNLIIDEERKKSLDYLEHSLKSVCYGKID